MKKLKSALPSPALPAFIIALVCCGVALADDVHECNGVFTTQPCSEVPENPKPGVSTVPSRNLDLAPVEIEKPAARAETASQNQVNNKTDSNIESNQDQTVTVYEGYDSYRARKFTSEEAQRAHQISEAQKFGREGTNSVSPHETPHMRRRR